MFFLLQYSYTNGTPTQNPTTVFALSQPFSPFQLHYINIVARLTHITISENCLFHNYNVLCKSYTRVSYVRMRVTWLTPQNSRK